jgi:hypothetical protein
MTVEASPQAYPGKKRLPNGTASGLGKPGVKRNAAPTSADERQKNPILRQNPPIRPNAPVQQNKMLTKMPRI